MSSRPTQDLGTSVQMEFTLRLAYRRNFSAVTFCDHTTINSGNLFAPVANILCNTGCSYANQVIGTTDAYCSSFSEQDNWSYGYKSWV
jgi:hypothetical protein